MSASTLERTARSRRSRTRSRSVNGRPALALSALKPHQYDLRPACASLICPDCKTWVPITGLQTKKPKLVPHDNGRAGKDAAVRCRLGSNRLVTVNVTVKKWQERLEDGGAETASRQATVVLPKAFSPQTDRTLRARAERTLAGRVADWEAVLPRVADADKNRRAVPAGDRPTEGPAVPLKTLHPKRPAR
ncbi:hypothetical protein [Streptomyces sp. ALI-76-A]|uniref:hypothetical protein n=1 Tax=Streptomyces sp. ALI-76-A TaxID=3025736 RepID=UPI00256F4C6B|nr:hypothetical protein [Streptomyces sp. ALI-76-A]MDL5205293.1 hypothetical protein [Streptomyces sp. ALI-76-A]